MFSDREGLFECDFLTTTTARRAAARLRRRGLTVSVSGRFVYIDALPLWSAVGIAPANVLPPR